MSVAIVDSRGAYQAVVVSGVAASLEACDVAVPESAGVILLQNEIPAAANLEIARKIAERATLILSAAPARSLDPELLDRVNLLIVNRVEARHLAGADIAGREIAVAGRLAALCRGRVIVTLGEGGLIIGCRHDGVRKFPAHAVTAVSTHGAGDAFVGALTAGLAGGQAIDDAVRFAQAAAALFVSTSVEDRARLTRRDVLAFLSAS